MRRLWWTGPGEVVWREAPEPEIAAAHQAIVQPIAATTCDLDVMILRGTTPFAAPMALGHECVARVVALGAEAKGLAVGQIVAVPWHVSCGACPRCRRRLPNTCSSFPPGAMFGMDVGGDFGSFFSDLVLVPHATEMLVPLPDGLDPAVCAAASDNLPFGYELTVPYLAERPGAEVLVMGGVGSVGLYAVAYAKAAGADEVVYVDTAPDRLERAEAYGARVVQGPPPRRMPRSFPITVDASGTDAGLRCAISSTEPEGQSASVGTHWSDVAFPMREMYAKGLSFYTGRGRGHPNIAAALAFVADGRVDPRGAITDFAAFDEAPRRLAEPRMKTVFVRD
ncbi:zinc-dependent alcohol dehydrogenase [Phenylobacterium soli]|uniref:Alcohol dehydrogenase n=1 Tax=Phenylobacterium soli TaxID=2170551 RepID=A0A328AKV3_9CAUL|nr:zinc-binding dehydrogenase [Phenylobacterium soli]RAK55460.1 alcohol dehydrogenase [Phenylobacterium soli]